MAKKKQSSKKKTDTTQSPYGHLGSYESFQFALHVATVAVLIAVMVNMVTTTVATLAPAGQVAGMSTMYR